MRVRSGPDRTPGSLVVERVDALSANQAETLLVGVGGAQAVDRRFVLEFVDESEIEDGG